MHAAPRSLAPAHRWPALLLFAGGLVLGSLLGVAREAWAIKWRDCPAVPVPLYRSTLGATSSPFVHPGHALRISLNEAQTAASGGFSLEPDGNEVEIVFASLFGEPVPLAPRRATATTPDLLEITFPDAAAEVGRVLAGPVAIRVRRGDVTVAEIAANDLVGLPPATDLTGFVLGEGSRVVIPAALGASGDLWIPVAFHGDPMAMPGCPGNYIQPVPILVGGALLAEDRGGRRDPLRQRRRMSFFLGDVVINDASFYGVEYMKRLPTMHVAGTTGLSICRMNDSIDVVLRLHGGKAWARSKRSPFAPLVRDASPVRIELRAMRALPGKARWLEWRGDTLGHACTITPPHSARDEHASEHPQFP